MLEKKKNRHGYLHQHLFDFLMPISNPDAPVLKTQTNLQSHVHQIKIEKGL